MGCNACNSVYRVPLLSLLEALLKWLQKGGKGCGMWNQTLALSDTIGIIEAQNRHRDPSFWGQRLNGRSLPGEVGRPFLGAWIEQRDQRSCH